jgi:ABC-2 type transport system ATP-binding protein
MAPVEIRGLSKRFGKNVLAVNDLSFDIEAGRVTGFLGPNGAGKSTTLRALLGLVRPTGGTATFDGRRYEQLERPSTKVGAVLEDASFHPGRTARNHLRVLAVTGEHPAERVDVVLETVGLTPAADRPVKGYSMGMRQRLSIASALLGDPEVLILDEPTNGLDPAGMAEMREFIRSLANGGRTVVLSSHLMGEIEQVSDRVGVIRGGALVAEGTVEELRGRAGLRVRAEPLADAARVVGALPDVDEVTSVDGMLDVTVDTAQAAAINRVLVEAGIAVSEIYAQKASLEDVFLELTANGNEQT